MKGTGAPDNWKVESKREPAATICLYGTLPVDLSPKHQDRAVQCLSGTEIFRPSL